MGLVTCEVVTFDVATDVTRRCETTSNDTEHKIGEMASKATTLNARRDTPSDASRRLGKLMFCH